MHNLYIRIKHTSASIEIGNIQSFFVVKPMAETFPFGNEGILQNWTWVEYSTEINYITIIRLYELIIHRCNIQLISSLYIWSEIFH